MHCSFCARSIERAYERTEGVRSVSVSLAHEEALIEYDEARVDETTLRDTLRDVGYTIRDPDKTRAYEQARDELRQKRSLTVRAGVAAAGVALVMVGMWLDLVAAPLPRPALVVAGALAAWVLFVVGRGIVGMAIAGLRRRIFNQHVLLFAGALGGFLAGVLGLLGAANFPVFHFFGAAIFLMAYHLLSGWVATKVRARSQEAVRRLLDLRPDTARRIEDGCCTRCGRWRPWWRVSRSSSPTRLAVGEAIQWYVVAPLALPPLVRAALSSASPLLIRRQPSTKFSVD